MPDETEQTPLEQVANNSEKNAEVAAKLQNQDQSLKNTPSEELARTGDALDALAAKVPEKKEDAEPKPVKDEEKKDEPKAAPKTTPKADEPATDPIIEANKKRADELFKDSPSLPANASPKSTEAFSSIKIKAAQEISTLEGERDKLRKENEELQAKLKDPVPAEITKELQDHRTWRAKLDVELDPKFKQYDKAVSDAQEFIYSQLRKSPVVTDEIIEKIKKEGGPENVNFDKLFDTAKDPVLRRLVESKIADIEMAKFNKQQAIKSTQDNVSQYLIERQKEWEDSAVAHNTATKGELDNITGQIEWMREKSVSGTNEEQAIAKAHNKTVTEIQESLKEGLRDDSPRMRAIMLAGMANLIYIQGIRASEKAAFDSEKAAHQETKKLLTDATAKIEKFKSASTSRLRESAAPPGGKLPEVKKDVDFRPASQAIDDIAKQISEERQRVSNVG